MVSDNGPTSCSYQVQYAYQYGWSVSVGGSIDFGSVQASTGFTISKNYQESSSLQCLWNGGQGPAQIWLQQRVYWADMQTRQCNNGQGQGKTCEPWSQYYRVNAPIKSGIYKHIGCSVGWDHTTCDGLDKTTCA